jgi:hypothetical protein
MDDLMTRFAERTGLTGTREPRRYLWTDAFAVCNFLGARQPDLARRLIDQVHSVLGPPGADAAHPTARGLRIGKPQPERSPDEPYDPEAEWDRDGQYFHYLTKWAHALDQVGMIEQARELMRAAHRAFVYEVDGHLRMYWKMSVDLSRPQVTSMGQHDPIDGFVQCARLRLKDEEADFRAMIVPEALATPDPLGIGGLLIDAYHLHQVVDGADALMEGLLDAALAGLRQHLSSPKVRRPEQRLAFRELGLAIGLAAAARMQADARRCSVGVRAALVQIGRLDGVRTEIVAYWSSPEHQQSLTYRAHEDINDVMLATTLAPEGFLVLRPI